jgi:hypothetical protein
MGRTRVLAGADKGMGIQAVVTNAPRRHPEMGRKATRATPRATASVSEMRGIAEPPTWVQIRVVFTQEPHGGSLLSIVGHVGTAPSPRGTGRPWVTVMPRYGRKELRNPSCPRDTCLIIV